MIETTVGRPIGCGKPAMGPSGYEGKPCDGKLVFCEECVERLRLAALEMRNEQLARERAERGLIQTVVRTRLFWIVAGLLAVGLAVSGRRKLRWVLRRIGTFRRRA